MANEATNMLNGLIAGLSSLNELSQDIVVKAEIKQAVADNASDVWATNGSAIGSDWGESNLVDTGRLRASYADVNQLSMQVVGDTLVFGSSVPYADYVDDKFDVVGLTANTKNRIGTILARGIARLLNAPTLRQG